MSEIGDNAKQQLLSIIERVENVEAEIKSLGADRSDIYKEAGSNGFDVPALKAIVRARREDAEKRQAREALVELYRETLGID
ncbi:MAG: GapR family DNA-binding domain-containing protein [Pseudomonadota bacterium]